MPGKIETAAVALGEMLRSGSTYKVPPYQRDYSWGEDEYERFWEDLYTTIEERRTDYFLGSMVVDISLPQTVQVIDGQQRLTTASLLLCALRDLLKETGNPALLKQADALNNTYLGRFEFQAGADVPNLELNKTNRAFYVEKIFPGADISTLEVIQRQRSQKPSNRLLVSCFLYFRKKLQELAVSQNWEAIVRSITDALQTKLIIIQIKVSDVGDAYLLFETLNDRGLALSVADLLKNYIFSKVGEDRLAEVQERWDTMAASLGSLPVKTFLRHYWLSTNGVVRDKELYNEIKTKYPSAIAVSNFAKHLRDAAEFYSGFSDPNHYWWGTFDPNVRQKIQDHLYEINLFGVSQYHPLMLAALESRESIFPDVLRLISIFSFRYSVIGQLGPGNVEKAVSDAAIFVRNTPTATASQVFQRLAHLYPDDESFVDKFKTKVITEAAVARYILTRINDHLTAQHAGNALITNTNPQQLNLEHILPKKFDDQKSGWLPQFGSAEETVEYVHRLGNMTLLGARINRALANGNFTAKKERGYAINPLKITEPLLNHTEWSKDAIDRRQEQMAQHAKAIWRLSYT